MHITYMYEIKLWGTLVLNFNPNNTFVFSDICKSTWLYICATMLKRKSISRKWIQMVVNNPLLIRTPMALNHMKQTCTCTCNRRRYLCVFVCISDFFGVAVYCTGVFFPLKWPVGQISEDLHYQGNSAMSRCLSVCLFVIL